MSNDVSNANDATNNNTIDFGSMSADEFESFDLDAFLSEHESNSNVEDNMNQDQQHHETDAQSDDDEQHEPDPIIHDNQDIENQDIDGQDIDNQDDGQDDNQDDNQDTSSDFEKILNTPIKANGHEIIVDTPEKARQLMQMGVNYNKKMQEIKPHLGLVRALKNEGLADDKEILNQLIDIAKGDKQALIDFANKKNIDLSDIEETDETEKYTPNENIDSEKDIIFDDTISILKEKDNYDTFTKNISNDFKDNSSSAFYENPKILEALSHDMDNGVYSKVMASVQSKKLFENDSRPTIDIYIDSYKSVVENMSKNKKTNMQKNVDATKVSKTPSRQKSTSNNKKVNLAEIDLFGMSESEADDFYEKYLKDLPT